ncbi:hypothetical protein, partial [Mesorhizobium sp. dw_380]|uniref:hypothetical protein n=1 Tax=Mesorhizobium sp. dw_380 TaxID=2812001 RepID=UPI001BDF6484
MPLPTKRMVSGKKRLIGLSPSEAPGQAGKGRGRINGDGENESGLFMRKDFIVHHKIGMALNDDFASRLPPAGPVRDYKSEATYCSRAGPA